MTTPPDHTNHSATNDSSITATSTADTPAATPPITPPEQPANATSEAPRPLSLRFTGTGSEYFRIWIVNLGLSLITLGLYSPWAKVRTARWFYGHTWLDGESFNYLARPVQILKSRLVVLAFALAYFLIQQFAPLLSVVLILVIALLTPWVIVASLRFRARMSAYRGLRFSFTGKTSEAFVLTYLLPLTLPFTIGLLLPYYYYRQVRFIGANMAYGKTPSAYHGKPEDFWPVFGLIIGSGFVLIVAMVALIGILFMIGMLLNPDMDANNFALAWPFLLLALEAPALIAIRAAIKTSIHNRFFNGTTLGPVSLTGRLRMGGMVWLALSNLILLALTLGLYYPWARVRVARYYAEHITVQSTGDLNQFVADQQSASASAFGLEFADVFDIGAAL